MGRSSLDEVLRALTGERQLNSRRTQLLGTDGNPQRAGRVNRHTLLLLLASLALVSLLLVLLVVGCSLRILLVLRNEVVDV